MPLNFCLPPDRVDAFKRGLKSGEIDPEALSRMSSEERHVVLGKYVGEHAAGRVNAEFESKILLKNQQQGYLNWAKNVSGIKPVVRRDLIKKIENMDKILQPEDQAQFMEDLASQRLGVGVTQEEAGTIAKLSKELSEAKGKMNTDGVFDSKTDRMKYGYATEDLTDYVSGLKRDAEKLHVGELLKPSSYNGAVKNYGTAIEKGAGNVKAASAALDDSAIFRQGWKTFITNPIKWWSNAPKTFYTAWKEVGGKNMMREVNADIISRPNYSRYQKAGLAIKNAEEAFPEALTGKIPILGRLYKASESAYTGFVYKMRADVFDEYLKAAEKAGININDKEQLLGIGRVVNSLTGRSDLGSLDRAAGAVNNIFFSPRFLKSNFDTLTAHALDTKITPFARKQAALNLVKIITATGVILATADAIAPGSVDWDPRSTDFGKIRVGDTRFDVTGGMGSLVVLTARELIGSSKSASSGKITDLRAGGFNAQNQVGLFNDFIRNKLSPAASFFINSFTGTDSLGNKTDVLNEGRKAITPIGLQTIQESMANPNSANTLAVAIADGLGLSANTYSPSGNNSGKTSWSASTAKNITAFKQSVGDTKFNEAGKQFDDRYNKWISDTRNDPKYKSLSTDEQTTVITREKAKIQADIFKTNNFKYKAPKGDKTKINSFIK